MNRFDKVKESADWLKDSMENLLDDMNEFECNYSRYEASYNEDLERVVQQIEVSLKELKKIMEEEGL